MKRFAIVLTLLAAPVAAQNITFEQVIQNIKSTGKDTHSELLEKKKSIEKEQEESEIFSYVQKKYESKIAQVQVELEQKKAKSSLLYDSIFTQSRTVLALYQELAPADKNNMLNQYVETRLNETKNKIEASKNAKAKTSSYISYGLKPERENVIKDLVKKYDDLEAGMDILEENDLTMSEYKTEFKQLESLLIEDKKRIEKLKADISLMENTPSPAEPVKETKSSKKTSKKKT